jgi:hypothetical protein
VSSPARTATSSFVRRVGVAAVASVAFTVLVEASIAASSSYTIRTSDGSITRIGSMPISGPNGGTLARATATFGRPSRIDPIGDGSDGCRIQWRRLRLKATFANFSLESACSPSGGRLQLATVRSRRFRTTRGVRVGTRSWTIPLRHRNAEFVAGAWWIASVVLPFGTEEETPTIRALVRDGRVSALALYIGAAGD